MTFNLTLPWAATQLWARDKLGATPLHVAATAPMMLMLSEAGKRQTSGSAWAASSSSSGFGAPTQLF